MYIYRFRDYKGNVIYVGRTNNIVRRIRNEHFKNGHLPEECYREVNKVEYAEVRSLNESKMYELYYLDKYKPKYNEMDVGGGGVSFKMPELVWVSIDHNKEKTIRLTKKEMKELIESLGKELEDECSYISEFLRGKDQVEWVNKLDVEERNEYIRMVYLMERYVNSIKEIKDIRLESLR